MNLREVLEKFEEYLATKYRLNPDHRWKEEDFNTVKFFLQEAINSYEEAQK